MLIQLYSVLHMQRYKKYPTELTVFKIFAVFRFSQIYWIFQIFWISQITQHSLIFKLQNLSETSSFQGHQPTIKMSTIKIST